MAYVSGMNGDSVAVRWSRGGVLYFERWQDNVLAPRDGMQWPASVTRQVKSYVMQRTPFSQEDADALAANLGRISKFQSINSEDAVTWSWFGTLALEALTAQRETLSWLYDQIGLNLVAGERVRIDQWARVPHPNAAGRAGPELDARIDDPDVALVHVEAKWNAKLSTGKGAAHGTRDDQVVLRRDALRALDEKTPGRPLVVLCVGNRPIDTSSYNEQAGK